MKTTNGLKGESDKQCMVEKIIYLIRFRRSLFCAFLLVLSGCTNIIPEVSVMGLKAPSRAKIDNDYLAFSGTEVAYGNEMTVTDPNGNNFEFYLSHIRGEFRYFAAKNPGLIIKTGVIYSILAKNASASSTVPVIFESGGSIPSGGSEGQILSFVNGAVQWKSISLGSIAYKNTIADSEISSIDYSKITNAPTSFTPSTHTHAISDVTNLSSSLSKKIERITSGSAFFLIDNSSSVGAGSIDLQTSRSTASMVASGAESSAIGVNNTSSGYRSHSVGTGNYASSSESLAVGNLNRVEAVLGKAFGHMNNVKSTAHSSITVGSENEVGGSYSATLGHGMVVDFDGAVSYGKDGNYKTFITGPIVFKASAISHRNKTFYCDTLIYISNGSFAKGFVIIKTDSASTPTIFASNPSVSYYYHSGTPTLSFTVLDNSVSVTSSMGFSKNSFECQNVD